MKEDMDMIRGNPDTVNLILSCLMTRPLATRTAASFGCIIITIIIIIAVIIVIVNVFIVHGVRPFIMLCQ